MPRLHQHSESHLVARIGWLPAPQMSVHLRYGAKCREPGAPNSSMISYSEGRPKPWGYPDCLHTVFAGFRFEPIWHGGLSARSRRRGCADGARPGGSVAMGSQGMRADSAFIQAIDEGLTE